MITFEIENAKNNETTLKINNHYIYSRYAPKRDAYHFVTKEFDHHAEGYIMVGLGLGYHLEKLIDLVSNKKEIVLLVLDNEEIELFKKFNSDHENLLQKVSIFHSAVKDSILNYQILIPPSFVSAIGQENPFHDFLQDILIRQRSFKKFSPLLEANFQLNVSLKDPSINEYKNHFYNQKACLISSGPSLDDMIETLKEQQDHTYILSVGSALKALLKNGIRPNAVIISDAQDNIQKQLNDINYQGDLFYLSTANHSTVLLHDSKRTIIFQHGYKEAETYASKYGYDLLETGGSVATVGFNLLEYMGFSEVFLIGQDLGFKENKTHSHLSTSGKSLNDLTHLKRIESNNGEEIYTLQNLFTYLRWFNKKMRKTNIKVYNTALNGAKIDYVPYINQLQFHKLIRQNNL